MQTVAITTLGCKTNQFESAAMSEALGKAGFQLVPFGAGADLIVINTCTVTARTDAESRRLIRRAHRQNPTAKIVVTGCYAQLAHAEISKLAGVNLVIGNLEKKGIVGLLRELGDRQQVLVADIAAATQADTLAIESFAEHTRAFLQIQNGCESYCSYCIVPYARGRSRSVPVDDVLEGIGTFTTRGFKEVVLTGIHLGGYGRDLAPQKTLLQLIAAVEERQLTRRLRIGSVEPTEIPDPLIALLAASEIVCPHLHIPLQSGDDRILARMNRGYATLQFRQLIEKIDSAIPDVCIGTDVITGFPGETEEEFANGYRFIESLPFAYLHVFPFSPREGTPASTMDHQLHSSVIKERAAALRRLSVLKKKAYFQKFVGRELAVLVQGREADGMLHGISRNYIPVVLPGEARLLNSEVLVKVTEAGRDGVRGVKVKTSTRITSDQIG